MIIPIYCCWIDGKYQSHYICVAREDLRSVHMQHPLYIYIHFCKHLLLRCVRISVKQMDKQLPGICFCRLATCAKMGMICSMCHRSACCSTTRRVAIVEHTVSTRAPFCLKANERGKWKTCIYWLIGSRAIPWDLSLPPTSLVHFLLDIFFFLCVQMIKQQNQKNNNCIWKTLSNQKRSCFLLILLPVDSVCNSSLLFPYLQTVLLLPLPFTLTATSFCRAPQGESVDCKCMT